MMLFSWRRARSSPPDFFGIGIEEHLAADGAQIGLRQVAATRGQYVVIYSTGLRAGVSSIIPVFTYMMATYDGSLLALLAVTVGALLLLLYRLL